MWYTSLTGGPNTEAPKIFEAKYPGVKLQVYRGNSEAIIQRVLQEAQAKRFLVDTIETTFPVLKVMQEYKLLAPYFSPHLAHYPAEAKEDAGKGLVYWTTDRESYIGLAYNTNSVQGNAVPKGFDDLLKPELKGRIGFATSDTGARMIGAMLKANPMAAWSLAETWDYLRGSGGPTNELHARGFISIGCEPCTRATGPGEHERAGRWWWEEATKRECGLHLK